MFWGIEPRTSRALSENHTTRPNSRYAHTLHRISLGLGASEVQACLLFAVSGPTAHPRGIKIGPAECGLSTQRVGAAFWAARYSITKISTPVGFGPTWGNPVGLAGRRLNRSAKEPSACCQGLNSQAQAEAPNTHTHTHTHTHSHTHGRATKAPIKLFSTARPFHAAA